MKPFLISFETIEGIYVNDKYPDPVIEKRSELVFSDTYENAVSKIKESGKYSQYKNKKSLHGDAIRNFQNNTIE